jgi:excinuclease ABC subunit A
MPDAIHARGVRVHNLKNIDVSIPTGRLIVVTGVSGSGKSSLAFDTFYAEGQRRYVESLSAYARQFLERIQKPDVESFEGMCPAVAIRQRTSSRNPRSTVATATEIHDHLRLLFGRVGRTQCDSCGAQVSRDSPESATDRLLTLPPDSRAVVCFPLALGGTPLSDLIERLRRRGFARVLLGGEVRGLEALEAAAEMADPILVVVDRIQLDSAARGRLTDSLELAFAEGSGAARVSVVGGPMLSFSDRFECARCSRAFEEPQPRLFSFNSPFGACPTCHGFGNLVELDVGLLVPDKSKSLGDGAIEPWNRPHYRSLVADMKRMCRRRGIPLGVAWQELSEEQRRLVLEGDEDFQGVTGFFRWLETKKYKVQVRVFLSRYRGYQSCPTCQGSRLRGEALQVRIAGMGIHEMCQLSVRELKRLLPELTWDDAEAAVATPVLGEIGRRLGFLADVGLDYLTLDRSFGSLSGGETQRIALATSLGTGLVGTLYVLDEPSVGLHPRDTDRLIDILKALRAQGNTVLVVEHDRALMKAADHVLDLGPGPGDLGGRVVFQGSYPELLRDPRSLTAKYLRGDLQIPVPAKRRRGNGLWLGIRGATAHNLKGIDVRIPLGAFTCVTGVSGSGKSSLVRDVLCAGLLRRKGRFEGAVGEHSAIDGADHVDDVIVVDQSPIGRTPRSNPVTYIKAFDAIREVFAATRDAKSRGLTASHFSFNVPGGRCEACLGDGQVRVDMQFLADVHLVCEVCGGRRYRPAVLEVRYRGRSIIEVLDMTIHEALRFFQPQARLVRRLRAFEQIGLGYLRLGQSASTLSGGEAQRVKLAAHLLRRAGERIVYVLDEPTTGLHMGDVADLLACLSRLLDAGASLVVIEHNMDVVKQADWVVDLGPEGGQDGGELLFQGTPEGLAVCEVSRTARYLRSALQRSRALAV